MGTGVFTVAGSGVWVKWVCRRDELFISAVVGRRAIIARLVSVHGGSNPQAG
jgi:hypothetical protein